MKGNLMPIKKLNIKIDEKLDNLFTLIKSKGGLEDKVELIKTLIIEWAMPNLFDEPIHSAQFLKGLLSFLKDKAYETPSKYYITLQLEDELTPFKQIVEVYVNIFQHEKEIFDGMTDEILVFAILDVCEYMYRKQMKLEEKASKATLH